MDDNAAWKKRLNTASLAQSKYLWFLLILGLFYWVVQPVAESPEKPASLTIPALSTPLPSWAVLASAPAVLFFVIIVIFGTMRAWATAESIIDPEPGDETIDEHPNAMDWATYTTDRSPQWVRRILSLGYPSYLSLFALEAWYFLVSLPGESVDIPGRWPLVMIASAEGTVVFWLLTRYWLHVLGGGASRMLPS